MVVLLAQGDVDRCSLLTKEKRGAGRRGCCPPVFTQNFSDYLLLHTSARAIPLMFTRIMSLPLFPGLLLWIGNFFFYSRIFEVLPGRLSSKHRKEHWMSLWEKEEAISGFSLKKRLPSAATFSWGKWFPAIFPSGWEWLSLLPQPVGGCSIKEVSAIPSPAVVKRRQEQPGCPHPSLPLCIQACPLVIWNQIILVTHQRS